MFYCINLISLFLDYYQFIYTQNVWDLIILYDIIVEKASIYKIIYISLGGYMLEELIKNSDNIVFFGGAGVSTESGIPDFRSVDGLYNKQYDYDPETIVSHGFFMRQTQEFYDFYKHRMIYEEARPNVAHLKLAELEKQGKLKAVITQNIDGLHQMAGSKNVIELHGSIHRNYCMRCGKRYDLSEIVNSSGVPRCDCGGLIKPDVVLYGEALNEDALDQAIKYINQADMLIIGGTSLMVYPAASLVNFYRGNKLVLINLGQTTKDKHVDYFFQAKLGEMFDF